MGTTSRPPKWIKPQLTRLVDEAPTGNGWLHEIKYDGYRMHARIDGGKVALLTRTGLDWSHRYRRTVDSLPGQQLTRNVDDYPVNHVAEDFCRAGHCLGFMPGQYSPQIILSGIRVTQIPSRSSQTRTGIGTSIATVGFSISNLVQAGRYAKSMVVRNGILTPNCVA